jgi:hypothetical protein
MAVYGPVRHQKNIIWTSEVTKKYYMDLRSFGTYNIFLVTDWSIYCHMTLSAMNYLLFSNGWLVGFMVEKTTDRPVTVTNLIT